MTTHNIGAFSFIFDLFTGYNFIQFSQVRSIYVGEYEKMTLSTKKSSPCQAPPPRKRTAKNYPVPPLLKIKNINKGTTDQASQEGGWLLVPSCPPSTKYQVPTRNRSEVLNILGNRCGLPIHVLKAVCNFYLIYARDMCLHCGHEKN